MKRKKAKFKIQLVEWRYNLMLGLIGVAALGLVSRIVDLTIIHQPFLKQQGDERVLRVINTPPFRGIISDRNGFPLAVSTVVYSAWVNPKEITLTPLQLSALAKLISMDAREIKKLIAQKKSREFLYLKRSLSPEIAKHVKALAIPGLFLQEDYHRYYPEGDVMAHVIGFTNVDDKGQEGLELTFNQWLRGEPGKKWVVKDRLGRVIADVQAVKEQKPGHDLQLTIDRRIQYIAYRELMAGVSEAQATSGSAVVLDVKTGEILAMVNVPTYNPNNRPIRAIDTIRNRAVTDTFEPGSTIKAFSVAAALESGKVKLTSTFETDPGWLRVGHNLVQDEKNYGTLTLAGILQHSSNVGVTKMILLTPPDQLWEMLHNVGFGEATNIGFPGEQTGVLVRHNPWGSFTLATLAFGYGLSVTPVQLAEAYAVLANHGVKLPVSLIKPDQLSNGQQVMKPAIANEVVHLLESVLAKGGTGETANVPGYRVAGKTGTSNMVGVHGYQKNNYTASFVGIAPVAHPQLVVVVIIHDPQGKKHHGGSVSGPVFSKIMEASLRTLNIPPDVVS